MQAFREGAVRFLIATDVAARGLDVAGLPCVINMTLPDRSSDYIHRVGRVGAPLQHQPSALPVAEPRHVHAHLLRAADSCAMHNALASYTHA